jgi:NuA3 HAT complex component NTO1
MEPVEGVENVPKSRWKLVSCVTPHATHTQVCSLCKERVGACIQCENKSCFTAFHVTCARQMGLLMSMKLMGADEQMRAYCDKHLPLDWKTANDDDTDDNDDDYRDSETDDDSYAQAAATPVPNKRVRKLSPAFRPVTPKTARAYTKSYRPGPPIVPRLIVNKLLDYVAKVSFHKKKAFVERLCRFWSLKREARRGAPLLKRLHLEPWTATSESREQTEAERAKKLEVSTEYAFSLTPVPHHPPQRPRKGPPPRRARAQARKGKAPTGARDPGDCGQLHLLALHYAAGSAGQSHRDGQVAALPAPSQQRGRAGLLRRDCRAHVVVPDRGEA